MQVNKSQIAQFHTLLNKHGLMDDKRNIISEISGGRTTSTLELTYTELQYWINAMNVKHNPSPRTDEGAERKQKMINSIIAMAREMGVIQRRAAINGQGKVEEKSDYTEFNKWMLEKSWLKKRLNDYSYKELTILVSQYQNIYMSWIKKY